MRFSRLYTYSAATRVHTRALPQQPGLVPGCPRVYRTTRKIAHPTPTDGVLCSSRFSRLMRRAQKDAERRLCGQLSTRYSSRSRHFLWRVILSLSVAWYTLPRGRVLSSAIWRGKGPTSTVVPSSLSPNRGCSFRRGVEQAMYSAATWMYTRV